MRPWGRDAKEVGEERDKWGRYSHKEAVEGSRGFFQVGTRKERHLPINGSKRQRACTFRKEKKAASQAHICTCLLFKNTLLFYFMAFLLMYHYRVPSLFPCPLTIQKNGGCQIGGQDSEVLQPSNLSIHPLSTSHFSSNFSLLPVWMCHLSQVFPLPPCTRLLLLLLILIHT